MAFAMPYFFGTAKVIRFSNGDIRQCHSKVKKNFCYPRCVAEAGAALPHLGQSLHLFFRDKKHPLNIIAGISKQIKKYLRDFILSMI
jgi:hypothetical protein